jgi:hypothetical protein
VVRLVIYNVNLPNPPELNNDGGHYL